MTNNQEKDIIDIFLTNTTQKVTETISLSSATVAVAKPLSSTDEILDTGGSIRNL